MVSGSGVCAKRIMVDARHHMLDRLSSIIAEELLNGQKSIVAHYEETGISADLARLEVT
jgi:large subunit ribosomal protein L13Ae